MSLDLWQCAFLKCLTWLECSPDRVVDPPHEDREERIMAPENFPLRVFHLWQQKGDNTNLGKSVLSVSPSEIWYSLWDNSQWRHFYLEPLGLGLGEAFEEAGSVHGDRLHLLLPLTQSSHLLVFDTTTRVWNKPTLWFNKSGSSSVWSLGQVITVLISSRRPLLRYFGRACLLRGCGGPLFGIDSTAVNPSRNLGNHDVTVVFI